MPNENETPGVEAPEEATEPEATADKGENPGPPPPPPPSLEDWKSQAEAYRSRAEELESKWQAAQEALNGAKTPEEVATIVAEHDAAVAAERLRADRAIAAHSAGLPIEWADRLKGDDLKALTEDAKSIASTLRGGTGGGEPGGGLAGAGAGSPSITDPAKLAEKYSSPSIAF